MASALQRFSELERALISERSVLDCAVRARGSEDHGIEIIAYVVPSGAFSEQTVRANLRSAMPGSSLPDRYVLLSGLPFSNDGTVDEEALARFEIVDEQTAKAWEQKLLSLPGIRQAAVVIEPQVPKLKPLHISDLLPNTKALRAQQCKPALSSTAEISAGSPPTHNKVAISHGGALCHPGRVPPTLQKALERAAATKPPRYITYVQADGSEVIHSYAELLDDSEHILGGLRNLGLRPGDKVIFQFDRNQDFIPAFWACVLGGFIAAPISIAPTSREVNSTIQKLHNSWEMLGNPVILAGERLANDVRNAGVLLGVGNFRVETVEDLRTSVPDSHWHQSRPEDVCLMLLTSGSTGLPKGVLQTHRSLMHRSAGTAELTHFDPTDVLINWFPLDHVGGIVMSHLMALFGCASQIHIPTEVILQEPLRWLDLIDRHRATVTWAPNFAFGLINDHDKELHLRHWDLSCMRFILNGGEAIVPKTARKFLQLLAKHGLRSDAMHPAWGMSETCSGITFSDRCSIETISDEQSFMEVGAPIPGVSLRIVDDQDRLREEGQIGRLQVTGLPVTTGYYKNPELSRESFSQDGWFNTGDLGLLRDGRLTITGRAKDVIIVNGLNFYSHEVEAVVEEVEGIQVSFTAACPVRVGERDTDQVAIFFNARLGDWTNLLRLMKEIRETLIRKMGIKPDFLIPLPEAEIPRTTIGKIQRSKLRQRFEAGDFGELLKQIDIESSSANTLPDWFHEEVWVRRERAASVCSPQKGTYLVFMDELGLADVLCRELTRNGSQCIQVRKGLRFELAGNEEYRLNPRELPEYQQLAPALHARGVQVDHLLHFWCYGNLESERTSARSIREGQDHGAYGVCSLLQALANVRNPSNTIRLFVITNNAQITSSDEKIVQCAAAAVPGLLLTAELELPWIECRHVDLEIDLPETNAQRVLSELKLNTKKPKIAYRTGQRLEALLSNVDMLRRTANPLPIQRGGLFLITGGLGGLGVGLAQYLAREHDAKLILIGRTSLPKEAEWPSADVLVARKIRNYADIREASPEARYEALDIADVAQVRKCIANAERYWNQPLSGVFHLAGSLGGSENLRQHWEDAEKHLIARETVETFESIYHAKVYGTWALFEALRDKPETLFVAFSSVNALFGGRTFSAYSAANAFLRCFCLQKRHTSHPRTFCFDWSMWDGIGMTESSPEYARELARNMGFQIIRKEQGIDSLLAGLCRDSGQLVVGLDSTSSQLRGRLHTNVYPLTGMAAFYTAKDGAACNEDLEQSVPANFARIEVNCRFQKIREMPLTESKEIDKQKLIGVERKPQKLEDPILPGRSETERRVAKLWREVLNLPEIQVNDTFFELGGDSLAAMRLVNQLRGTFGIHLSIRTLFEKPTISELALAIDEKTAQEQESGGKGSSTGEHRAVTADELLSRIDEIPDSEVDALLQEMTGNEFIQ